VVSQILQLGSIFLRGNWICFKNLRSVVPRPWGGEGSSCEIPHLALVCQSSKCISTTIAGACAAGADSCVPLGSGGFDPYKPFHGPDVIIMLNLVALLQCCQIIDKKSCPLGDPLPGEWAQNLNNFPTTF